MRKPTCATRYTTWAILRGQLVLCMLLVVIPYQTEGRGTKHLKSCYITEVHGQNFCWCTLARNFHGSVLQFNSPLKKDANKAVQEQLPPFKEAHLTYLYAVHTLHLSTAFQCGHLELVAIYGHVILTARYWWEQHGDLGLCGQPAGNSWDAAGWNIHYFCYYRLLLWGMISLLGI